MSDIIPFATGDSGDPFWSDVQLLIQPTDLTIADLSPAGLTLTANGGADNIPRVIADASAPTGYSLYFPSATSATDGYISAGTGSQAAAPGDHTIECIIRGSSSGDRGILGAVGWGLGTSTGVTGTNLLTTNPAGTLTWDTTTWNYIVYQNCSARDALWINGVQYSAGTAGSGLGGSSNELFVGRHPGATQYRQGHIAALRWTKAARYAPESSFSEAFPTS